MNDTNTPDWAIHDVEPGMCPECEGMGCDDCSLTGWADVPPPVYSDHDEG